MKVNDEQRKAVECDEHVCVASCPGSGKTRTAIARILRCLNTVRDTSRRIACITYTHAAVDEIESRLRRFSESDDQLYYEVSTIHSFCLNHILRPFGNLLPELKDGFQVFASDHQLWHDIVKLLVRKHRIDGRRDSDFERVTRTLGGGFYTPPSIPLAAANEFIAFCTENRLVTFSDIVYFSAIAIDCCPYISRGLSSRFRHLIVDEFQDTSEAQVCILRAIARHNRTTFFLVGDPNQSIMSFAGSRPELMQRFADDIGARSDFTLRGNHRCSQLIVDHAEIICPSSPPMRAVGDASDCKEKPSFVLTATSAQGLFEHFLPAVDELNIPLGRTAVLAPWWPTLMQVGRELRNRGIPISGPGARPYRRSREFSTLAEHVCAYIELNDPNLLRATTRALFITLLNLTGQPEWRVYSYTGRKVLFGLIAVAKEIRSESESAERWIKAAAFAFSDVLIRHDFLPDQLRGRLPDSADDMLRDMAKNDVDVANLRLADLGVFAVPERCMHFLTMHGSKGREFDAVAIIDLHDGKVPDFRCTSEDEFQEARRLLYVAITRARRLLMYFCDAADRRNQPSRYLCSEGLGVARRRR
jgi:DNA helicase-2/ATP-dependent DNA helicase PcrA